MLGEWCKEEGTLRKALRKAADVFARSKTFADVFAQLARPENRKRYTQYWLENHAHQEKETLLGRTDVTLTTATTCAQSHRHLTTFFGADKPRREITEGDADLWRLHLTREGLAEASVRKFSGVAKQLFKAAVKRKLVASNSFSGLESSAKAQRPVVRA